MSNMFGTRARALAIGIGIGIATAVPVISIFPGAASADATCYTGCPNPTPGSTLPFTNGPSTPTASTSVTQSSLPFTGADIGELAVVGVGAIGAGTVLLRRSRRRRTV